MASFKALCLAGVASLAVTATAHAADLALPPPPPVYIPPQPVAFGGWYLRGDVGVAINQLSGGRSTCTDGFGNRSDCGNTVPDFSHDGKSMSDSAILGAGVGYESNFWRADVTGEYHTASHYAAYENYTGSPNCPSGSGYYCLDGYSGSISSAVFLANGYIKLGSLLAAYTPVFASFNPYVGAGVGASVNMFHDLVDYGITNAGAFGQAVDRSNTTFAWAIMAGITYDLTPNWKVDFGYRFLDQGRVTSNAITCNNACTNEVQSYRLTSHDIRLGLRYVFADVAPPQPVLVRKY